MPLMFNDPMGNQHKIHTSGITDSEMKDAAELAALRQRVAELEQGQKLDSSIFLEMFVQIIAATSDAAIVANQEFHGGHVLNQLMGLIRDYKAEKEKTRDAEARSALLAKALLALSSTDMGEQAWSYDEHNIYWRGERADESIPVFASAALTPSAQAAAELWRAYEAEHEAAKPLMDREVMTPFISAWEFESFTGEGEEIHSRLKAAHEAVEAAREAGNPK